MLIGPDKVHWDLRSIARIKNKCYFSFNEHSEIATKTSKKEKKVLKSLFIKFTSLIVFNKKLVRSKL